ncbi:MAG TPA: chain length determinant protein tyrosine kinase EpsG [Noviherbaspirillum sp.]|nr:chain length determinant protein tyrosine kinase EpsG [Noviherbaspirillum sp.]
MNDRAIHETDLLSHHPRETCMGTMLVEMGKLKSDDVDRILRCQYDRGIRFGQAGVALGLIRESDIEAVLARQFDYAYLNSDHARYKPGLIAAHAPFGEQAETLRALRSQLKLRWFDNGQRSLAVMCLDKESEAETSLLVANLGVMFSQIGLRTLVVDANLRRPHQKDIFGLESRQGLSDMLAKRAGMESLCPVKPFPNLSVLPAGTPTPNPQELISRKAFIDLKQTFDSCFDVMLYDVPAFSIEADSATVAARSGGVLLVASKDRTRLSWLHEVNEQFAHLSVTVVGSVLVESQPL